MTATLLAAEKTRQNETPREVGFGDGLAGYDQTRCPYLRGGRDHAEWLAGWTEGHASEDY